VLWRAGGKGGVTKFIRAVKDGIQSGDMEKAIDACRKNGIDVSGPTSGTYEGVVLFQHRSNPRACDISGGGLFDVRGTMYLARGSISMDGNVDREVGRIVVNSLQLRGTARYTITGIGHPPSGPKSSFLVQ
jgi:hypothetical protein